MNILMVEDNTQLIQSLAAACRDRGWEVTLAGTGDQALDELHMTQFDVIMLEAMLPGGMNGFDILEELKRRDKWKQIPVIMLTNLESEEQTARAIGAVDFIVKSTASVDDIISRIQRAAGIV